MISLFKFPMPITSNKMYISIRGRLIKSSEARKYVNDVANYGLRNVANINEIKNTFKDTDHLHVHFTFYFPKDKLVTKKGLLKKLDSSNRIKSAADELAKLIGIDDKQFVKVTAEKIAILSDQSEFVNINISNYEMAYYSSPHKT